jgi:hypothetical protein
MGVFFSNIHVKKNDGFLKDDLMAMITENLLSKGYKKLKNAENDEAELVIYCPQDSEWITISSDLYDVCNENDTRSVAEPISDKLGTYVIAAACIDSDYAFMHLIGSNNGTDGWINSGTPYDGMKLLRRTSIAPWKNVVSDFDRFKAATKEKYVFAEEMLCNMAENLGMKPEQCLLEAGHSEMLDEKSVTRLFFAVPEEKKKEPPILKIGSFDLTPCVPNTNKVVFVNNKGGRSKGIAVMFTGDYIDNDEIEIYNATFESDFGSEKRKSVPISFTKRKSQDGKFVLWWEDKDFQIPPAVNKALPIMKQMRLEFEKAFGIRFFVRGNERMFLDIKVFIIPLENYQKGADCWYVYRTSGTKRKFVENMIDSTNEMISHCPESERQRVLDANPHMYLTNPDKYDLD